MIGLAQSGASRFPGFLSYVPAGCPAAPEPLGSTSHQYEYLIHVHTAAPMHAPQRRAPMKGKRGGSRSSSDSAIAF